jgi:hypothetical protein
MHHCRAYYILITCIDLITNKKPAWKKGRSNGGFKNVYQTLFFNVLG